MWKFCNFVILYENNSNQYLLRLYGTEIVSTLLIQFFEKICRIQS